MNLAVTRRNGEKHIILFDDDDAEVVLSRNKGVSWWRPRSRWRTQIQVNGQKRTVGTFRSEIDAALMYDRAARDAFGEFATLNFPGESS